MNKVQQLQFLLFGLLLSLSTCDDDCIYKECYCGTGYIACSNRGLTSFPQKMPTSETYFQSLNFDLNMISDIPNGHLPPNLEQLSMMGNPIRTIDDFAFNDSATTLNFLAFSNAVFTRLPDAFLYLKNLRTLDMWECNISDWNVEALKNLGITLETLDVQNCSLPGWPEWIQHLSHLKELILSRNSLSSVPNDALKNLTNSLTSLNLETNNLTSVPRALSQLSALKELYLDGNKITDVSWLPKTSKLNYISLSKNYIFDADQLSQALLPYGDSLTELIIDTNHLSAIPNMSFITQITGFTFSNNLISDPISGSLPLGVTILSLDHNTLPFIPKVLLDLKNVTDMVLTVNMIREIAANDVPLWTVRAELGYNLITELTDASFPQNSSLQELHLNNNPISRISNNAFMNLPHLYQLDLQYTKLTRLPLALATATSLNKIDFTGSTNLLCTCLEKSLQHAITSLYPDDVSGDCGLTSIYNFFLTLSESCPN